MLFDGVYESLSNFYMCDVTYNGITYLNTEAAFQAQKTKAIEEQYEFADLFPSKAKLKGGNIELREDWEDVKDNEMCLIVYAKFSQHPDLMKKLLDTGDEELVETNTWHDNYWGDCVCPRCINKEGKNHLGKILMNIREKERAK